MTSTDNSTAASSPSHEDRRAIILKAAFGSFGAYGFKRTSMDDIAKAAGISRPALYQSFANKEDIFRALVEQARTQSSAAASAMLKQDLPLGDKLRKLFDIILIDHFRTLSAMPHGEEVLGMKTQIAEDLFDQWDDEKRDLFEKLFASEPDFPQHMTLPFAAMLSLALAGMKAKGLAVEEMEREVDGLLNVIEGVVGKST